MRPRIAHITNHGYGGVNVPTGGAPDTGGQNVYVNAVVQAMVTLGYHVTVFARGGFPFYDSDVIREGIEPFGEHARYVYVPGGGDRFIRKEDIAVALDEEVDWLERFIADEAVALGCRPWEVYEIVNTHYWDAGVMGMQLVDRWRSTLSRELIDRELEGAVSREQRERLAALDSRSALGHAPETFAGKLLYDETDELEPPEKRIETAVQRWSERHKPRETERLVSEAAESFARQADGLSPALASLAAADAIGSTVKRAAPGNLEEALRKVDSHVFTPHSLGVLKEENFRDRPLEVQRELKFCERRDHELAICNRVRAFAATSTEIAERLRTRMGVDTERIFFFPPCIDRTKFKRYDDETVARSYAYLSEQSGIPADRLREGSIVFETSRMDRTKRKDLLLEAFAQAAREMDDAYLFIGGGPENDVFGELEAIRAKDPLLNERAHLLGFVPDEVMYPLFGMADLFVSASEMEGFGMSIAQAAAVGTPIVSSHLIPFAVQYVPDDAVIVRAGDVDGFARAIVDLLGDAGERERRGKRLEELTRPLDWVVQSDAFLDHLRRRGFEIRKGRPS